MDIRGMTPEQLRELVSALDRAIRQAMAEVLCENCTGESHVRFVSEKFDSNDWVTLWTTKGMKGTASASKERR
jgi:hypothetical protein